MPAINTKIVLSSAAQSANTVLADIDLIKGALYGVSTETDLDSIHPNYLQDGQLMYVQDVAKFFSLTITAANPPVTFVDTYEWSEVTLGASGAITSDDTGSFVLNSQTGSFLTSADTSSFVLVSQTSSMSVATASFISDSFISASAARSGFGAGGSDIPNGTISSSQQITDFGFISSSIDTSSFVLVSETGSFLTSEDTGSFVLVSNTSSMSVATASYVDPIFISASAAASGFGQGGDTLPSGTISGSQQITDFGFISSSVDISALNTFTGSIQDQVDALIAATGSYLDDTNTILVTQSEPTVAAGGLYFDGSDFYVGL
jgi:hypothetical protein